MDEECVHGLGDPAWCVLCNGREAAETRAEAARKAAARVPFWLFKRPVTRRGLVLGDTPGGDARMYVPEYASRVRDRQRRDWD